MKRSLRFFGQPTPGAPRIRTPWGLRCWECGERFYRTDSGVVLERVEERAAVCVALHSDCFARAAVSGLHASLREGSVRIEWEYLHTDHVTGESFIVRLMEDGQISFFAGGDAYSLDEPAARRMVDTYNELFPKSE